MSLSGGGKSTLMLKLMDSADAWLLTNDRRFVRNRSWQVLAQGVTKMPRINPSTIVNDSRLQRLLPEARQRELAQMPVESLWSLEEKYDLIIDAIDGDYHIADEAQLSGFLVLNWQHDSIGSLTIEAVQLQERPDLLGASMKSPEPFCQSAGGRFSAVDIPLDEQAYLSAPEGMPIYEVSGAIDFERALALTNEQGIWVDA